jgi:hypothetical protein
MQNNKISDLMRLQDDFMQKLISGEAGKDEIRNAIAIMRCTLQTANLGIRHGKASSRITKNCDYIPEVYFTKEASDAAKKDSTNSEENKEVMPWEESPKEETSKKETPKKETPKKEKS